MDLLFADTETVGIPLDTSASYRNVDNWPRIKQIAWIVYGKDGVVGVQRNFAITDDVDSASSNSSEYVPKTIKPIHVILHDFLYDLQSCDVIVGHNIQYDVTVILCEMYRLGLDTERLENLQQFCTMKYGVNVCGFDTKYGDRYPSLQELYTKIFHQPFENAHDAYCDIKATADCFWELVRRDNLQCEDYPYLMPGYMRLALAKEYVAKADAIENMTSQRNRQKQVELYQKAAIIDDGLYSLYCSYRIGHLYYYELNDEENAKLWYTKAKERMDSIQEWEYEYHQCYFLDALWEYAILNERHHWSDSHDTVDFYDWWESLCDVRIEELNLNQIKKYIDAYRYGWCNQRKDLNKAIEICQKALTFNRPEFHWTGINSRGLRYVLVFLYKEFGDLTGLFNSLKLYREELRVNNAPETEHIEPLRLYVEYYFKGEGLFIENTAGHYHLEHCKGANKDYAKAKQYLDELLLIKEDDAVAQYYLGLFYELGLSDVSQNSELAFRCFEKAAGGYSPALLQLGIMYLEGTGCNKSKKKAREYLEKAKEKGLEVSPHLEKAKQWF
jgi:TPR repeat protein